MWSLQACALYIWQMLFAAEPMRLFTVWQLTANNTLTLNASSCVSIKTITEAEELRLLNCLCDH